MTSRSNSWKSELSAEVSASQPISAPGPCSDPLPCPDCGLPSGPTCPSCDGAFCAAHLYCCGDCDSSFCAACLADHRFDGHWSDSDTAAELHQAHRLPAAHLTDPQGLCAVHPTERPFASATPRERRSH